MKKVLILGGSRFHGFKIAEKFHRNGDEVFVLNRGNYRSSYEKGINHLLADRNKYINLEAALKGWKFDVVIDNNAYNLNQMRSVLEILKGRFNHYVFISTAAVYLSLTSKMKLSEPSATGKVNEGYPPSIQEYAVNKYLAERFLQDEHKDVNFTIIRFPNIFGRGDFLGKLSYFYYRLKDGGKILLEKEIEKFSLLSVEDAVSVISSVCGNKTCYGKVINAADPRLYNYIKFFGTVFGDIFSMERVVLMPAVEMWKAGYSIPFAWGPMLSTTLCKKVLPDINFHPLSSWCKSTLQWELTNCSDRANEPAFNRMRNIEKAIIGKIM